MAEAEEAVVGDYEVPDTAKEVWKSFGCDTEAGRALRRLYAGSAPQIQYPKVRTAERPAPPKPVRRPGGQGGTETQNVPLPKFGPKRVAPPAPVYGVMRRKSEAVIRAETNDFEEYVHPPRPGRNRQAMGKELAEKFEIAADRGKILPLSAMPVYVGALPSSEKRRPAPKPSLAQECQTLAGELVQEVSELQAQERALAAAHAAEAMPKNQRKAEELLYRQQCDALTLRNKKAGKLRDLDLVLSNDVDE
jgi:hypothetical protein